MLIGPSRFAAERKTTCLLSRDASALTQANSFCSFLCHVVQLKTFLLTFRIFLVHRLELPRRDVVSLGIIMPTVCLRRARSTILLGDSRSMWAFQGCRGVAALQISPRLQLSELFFYSPVCFIKNTGICASSGNSPKTLRNTGQRCFRSQKHSSPVH